MIDKQFPDEIVLDETRFQCIIYSIMSNVIDNIYYSNTHINIVLTILKFKQKVGGYIKVLIKDDSNRISLKHLKILNNIDHRSPL